MKLFKKVNLFLFIILLETISYITIRPINLELFIFFWLALIMICTIAEVLDIGTTNIHNGATLKEISLDSKDIKSSIHYRKPLKDKVKNCHYDLILLLIVNVAVYIFLI